MKPIPKIRSFIIPILFSTIVALMPTRSNAVISTAAFVVGGSAAAKTAMIVSAITAGTGGALIGAGFLGAKFSKEWEPIGNPLYNGLIAGWIILPIGIIALSENHDQFALQFSEVPTEQANALGWSIGEWQAFSEERLQINAVMNDLFQNTADLSPDSFTDVSNTWETHKSTLSTDAIHAIEKLVSQIALR